MCVEHSLCADDIEAGRVRVLAVDATDATAVQRLRNRFTPSAARLTCCSNNAGRFVSMPPIWDSDLADWWEDVRVNILSVYTVTRAILPLMLRRDRGAIIKWEAAALAAALAMRSPRPASPNLRER